MSLISFTLDDIQDIMTYLEISYDEAIAHLKFMKMENEGPPLYNL